MPTAAWRLAATAAALAVSFLAATSLAAVTLAAAFAVAFFAVINRAAAARAAVAAVAAVLATAHAAATAAAALPHAAPRPVVAHRVWIAERPPHQPAPAAGNSAPRPLRATGSRPQRRLRLWAMPLAGSWAQALMDICDIDISKVDVGQVPATDDDAVIGGWQASMSVLEKAARALERDDATCDPKALYVPGDHDRVSSDDDSRLHTQVANR